jgi:hypothetical protein
MKFRFTISLTYSEPLDYCANFPVMPKLRMPDGITLLLHELGEAIVIVDACDLSHASQILFNLMDCNQCLSSIDIESYAEC